MIRSADNKIQRSDSYTPRLGEPCGSSGHTQVNEDLSFPGDLSADVRRRCSPSRASLSKRTMSKPSSPGTPSRATGSLPRSRRRSGIKRLPRHRILGIPSLGQPSTPRARLPTPSFRWCWQSRSDADLCRSEIQSNTRSNWVRWYHSTSRGRISLATTAATRPWAICAAFSMHGPISGRDSAHAPGVSAFEPTFCGILWRPSSTISDFVRGPSRFATRSDRRG